MTHPPYLREKARWLRTERQMSLNEIADRLALNKSTIWYWISDLPDPAIKSRVTPGRRAAIEAMAAANKARFKALRDAAYQRGLDEFESLDAEPGFRDFVCMYIGEGYKRCRNVVSLANSDPHVILLADFWICRFAATKVTYSFQHHADQDPDELIRFWSDHLNADPDRFGFQRKSNSGQLSGRNWRSRWGVLTVRAHDTQLRARLQGWIDRVKSGWLDSVGSGV